MQSHARLQLKELELIGTRKPYRNVSACRLGRVSVKPQSRFSEEGVVLDQKYSMVGRSCQVS